MRFQRSASERWRASANFIRLLGPKLLNIPLSKAPQANFLFPVVAVLLVAAFYGTQREVTISVDDRSMVIKTHLDNVGAILRDAGIAVQPGDIVYPSTSSSVSSSRTIAIQRSKPVILRADGSTISFRTQSKSASEVVRDGGLDLRKEDVIYVGDKQIGQDYDLTEAWSNDTVRGTTESDSSLFRAMELSSRGGSRDYPNRPAGDTMPLEITVGRAVPILLHDGETHGEIYTTQQILGDALASQGVTIHEEDIVSPRLGTQVTAKMHVFILRAKPITIKVDGRTIQARTQAKTIEQAILQEGVKLVGKDRTEPPRDAPVESNVVVKVTRVKEDVITEQEPIGFSVEYRPDPTLELDERQVKQEGINGLRKWQTRIVYENGEEVSRTIEKQWIESPQVNKVIGYGTEIVIRELETADGVVTYWRKYRMWVTSYNASHGGKSPDNPAYGLTRLGMRVTRGIVAVDPSVIPFYTRVYVSGYGIGLAADTGGAVKGMIVDLGFEETDVNMWSARWTDVYILTPVPPPNEIQYRLLDR